MAELSGRRRTHHVRVPHDVGPLLRDVLYGAEETDTGVADHRIESGRAAHDGVRDALHRGAAADVNRQVLDRGI